MKMSRVEKGKKILDNLMHAYPIQIQHQVKENMRKGDFDSHERGEEENRGRGGRERGEEDDEYFMWSICAIYFRRGRKIIQNAYYMEHTL